ncbi:tape measure protein [Latilactobacillus curvatus]|uniref:tape measure protein n=1 Tax=Latilactobacillus curvatus TaxID=28038 RepID=UPI000DAAF7F0|nr:tape measure protein [Latilactobacillus curvatus]AWV72552.1 phage tail tape measure protein [Latilactobacillus curvatus]
MADKKANVVMSFKSDGEVKLAQTVKELNTIMNTAAKQYRAQMSAMDSNASTTDRLASQQQKLSTQFDAAKRRTEMLTAEYNRMKSSGEANAAALTKQAGKVMDAERAENSLKAQLEKVNSQMTEQGQHANNAKDKLSDLQKTAGLLESEQKKLDSEFAVQRKELGANASETDKMTLAQKQLKQQTELTDRYIGNLEKQLKETKSAYGENSREANEMAAKLNNAKTAVSGVESEMRQMETTSKQSSSALGSFREKLSLGAIAGVASNAVSTLTGGIGDMVSQAAAASDAMQKFDSTMEFAGFGKDSINSAKEAVKKYADDTVYDLNTVANTTAQLAANGVKDYTGLTEAAGNLNAVAGGNADTFGSVAMVLTQTAGAGKLTTENWNQLADAIPGASGKLQEAMKKNGAYTGNFRDAMTDGQITADEFNQAIKQLGMSDAAKEAATSTKTFEGAIGSLQANVVTGIQNIIDQIGKANMTRMISTLSDGIVGALKLVVGALKTVSDHQTAFKTLAVGVAAFFAAFKTISVVTTVVNSIKSFNDTVKDGQGAMTAFNAATGINPFVIIIAAVVAVVAALVYFFTQTKTGKKIWQDFTKWLGETWKALTEKAKEIFGVLSIFFKLLWEGIKKATVDVWNSIKEKTTQIFTAIGEFFKKWGPTILAILAGPIGLIVKFVVDHWQQIKDTTTNVFNAVKTFLGNVWNGIKTTISNVVNGIKSAVSNTWNGIKNTTSSVWNGIKSVTSSVWNAIKSVISSVINAVKSAVSGAWNAISSTTSNVWNSIKSTTSSIWNGISSAISNVVNGIRNTVSNVWGGIRNTTSNVWNGIKSAMTGPVEAAKNIIGGIVDRIKGFFSGIHLSLPRIQMPALPHFKLNGSFSLKPPSVPHLGVDWYAKGGIFTKPTIFGQGPNGLKGAGEAGPEAALPLNAETLGAIGKGIASNMPGQNNGPVYLQIDGQTFGQIVGPYVDQYMSVRANDLNYGRGY